MNRRDNQCVFCNGPLVEMHRVPNFPIWMGATDRPSADCQRQDLIYTFCERCYQLQLNNLAALFNLYHANHNQDVVGVTWEQHYIELADFITANSKPGRVIEIGDPSAKLAKKLHTNAKRWLIVEPNPSIKSFDNVEFMTQLFGGHSDTGTADLIVHSHCLEHQYDPVDFLRLCRDRLNDDGVMIFSIPAMDKIMEHHSWPVLTMNFEHTLYMDTHTVQYMLGQAGFDLFAMRRFGHHSLMFAARKSEGYNFNLAGVNTLKASAFQKSLDETDEACRKMAKHLPWPVRTFLHGCHVTTQYVLSRQAMRYDGLKEVLIEGILDNAPSKQGKYLNGTTLKVFVPGEINKHEQVSVLTSHTGPYRTEIERQIRDIRHGVNLL